MKLDFVCVGAQKAGTTTLHDMLRQNSDVVLPSVKETKFFHDDEREQYEKGIDWYEKEYFPHYRNKGIVGEVDPEYLFFKEVPERLHRHNPLMMIIIILRNPAERAYSHYLMSFARGIENLSFSEALSLELSRVENSEHDANHYSYFTRGLYYEQVKRYVDIFGRKQLLILEFKEFLNDEDSIKRILDFIGASEGAYSAKGMHSNPNVKPRMRWINKYVNNDFLFKRAILFCMGNGSLKRKIKQKIIKLNTSGKRFPPLDESVKRKLIVRYRDDVDKLSKLVGKDFTAAWY